MAIWKLCSQEVFVLFSWCFVSNTEWNKHWFLNVEMPLSLPCATSPAGLYSKGETFRMCFLSRLPVKDNALQCSRFLGKLTEQTRSLGSATCCLTLLYHLDVGYIKKSEIILFVFLVSCLFVVRPSFVPRHIKSVLVVSLGSHNILPWYAGKHNIRV